jgi:hypothetical protein
LSRAAHRRIYSFFTALRARSFIHIFTQTHHIPLPQLVQAVTVLVLFGQIMSRIDCLAVVHFFTSAFGEFLVFITFYSTYKRVFSSFFLVPNS